MQESNVIQLVPAPDLQRPCSHRRLLTVYHTDGDGTGQSVRLLCRQCGATFSSESPLKTRERT